MAKKIKNILLIAADVCLAAYICAVFFVFHSPEDDRQKCRGVSVNIADGMTHGFIDNKEVEARMKRAGCYPAGKAMSEVNCRDIEEALLATPFIRTAQCFTTINGIVNVEITQRMPVVRIKSSSGGDYYIDDKNCIMPLSNFVSDIIIATGSIDSVYATRCVAPLARAISADDFCRNLFQQINITADKRVELVPQVGNNIILLGQLPSAGDTQERENRIEEYVKRKMNTLRTFYKYGLSVTGWSRYSVINLEYDNQIVCKRRKTKHAS